MSENNTVKYEEKTSKRIKDIDELLRTGAFGAAKERLDELESSEKVTADPRYYIRRILAEKKDTSLSHLLYEDRRYPTLLKETLDDPNWAKACEHLSEEDKIFEERVDAFYDISCKIYEHIKSAPAHMHLSVPDPKNRENDHKKLDVKPEDTPDNSKKKYTGSTKPTWKILGSISIYLFAFLFYLTVKTGDESVSMLTAFMIPILMVGFCVYLCSTSDTSEHTQPKPPIVNPSNKSPHEIETENAFRKEMVRLKGLQWDAYKDMEEAEKDFNRNRLIADKSGPEEQKAVLSGKTCLSCGSNMAFDKDKKILVCPFCGSKKTLDVVDDNLSIESIDRLILERRYTKAATMVVEMKKKTPDDPALLVRSIRCSFRKPTIYDALYENRKNESEIRRIFTREEWDILREVLPEDKTLLVTKVKAFCSVSMKLLGQDLSYIYPDEAKQRLIDDMKRLDRAMGKKTNFQRFSAGNIDRKLLEDQQTTLLEEIRHLEEGI